MKAFYHDHFILPLPEGHRFPMSKYFLLRAKLITEAILSGEELLESDSATDEQLLHVHTSEYLDKVKQGTRSEKEIRHLGSRVVKSFNQEGNHAWLVSVIS